MQYSHPTARWHSSFWTFLHPPPTPPNCMKGSFWNDACMFNSVRGRFSLLQHLSSMYKDFKSLKDIYKDKCKLHVTIHDLEKLRDPRASAIGNKRGKVPIRSGKRATAGMNGIVFLKSGMMDQDLGMSKAGEEGHSIQTWTCNVVTFLRGGHQNIQT